MHPLTSQDVEAELSYAYVHAVASAAGMGCEGSTRVQDANGIDAKITAWGPFQGGGYQTEVDLKIQLKATKKTPIDDGQSLSYFVAGKKRYNDLTKDTLAAQRLLVVLFLPQKEEDWLHHGVEHLILRQCCYWVSLRGAPQTTNETGETVKIPKSQRFGPNELREIVRTLSHGGYIGYKNP